MADVVVNDADWLALAEILEIDLADLHFAADRPLAEAVARYRIAAFEAGLAEGRQQALEEAAKVAERGPPGIGIGSINSLVVAFSKDVAAAIRAIGDKE